MHVDKNDHPECLGVRVRGDSPVGGSCSVWAGGTRGAQGLGRSVGLGDALTESMEDWGCLGFSLSS